MVSVGATIRRSGDRGGGEDHCGASLLVGTRSEELKCRVLRDQFYRSSKRYGSAAPTPKRVSMISPSMSSTLYAAGPLSGSTGASETTVVASVPSYQIPTVLSVA